MTAFRIAAVFWALLLAGVARADTALALDRLCHRPDLAPIIDRAAKRHHVSPLRLVVLMASESTCREDAVNPVTHTLGLFQILTTGSANPGHLAPAQLLDPDGNADLGAAHLARLLRLCGSFGGALAVFHGRRFCSSWRSDKHVRLVIEMERALSRWIHGKELKTWPLREDADHLG